MIEHEVFDVNGYKMAIAKDDAFFFWTFDNGSYWDWDTLQKLKQSYIDKNKNIVEIGAHCGTSTCFYSRATNKRVIAFEPQKSMFELLEKNICQNDLKNVDLRKQAVFYKNDNVFMDDIDTHRVPHQGFNRGGLSLGVKGEPTKCIILNDLDIDDCGFLHVDAQGAEQHIFYSGMEFIKKHRPIILWENNIVYEKSLCDRVNLDKSIPNDVKNFDIVKALTDLGYTHSEKWSGIDTLSIPTKIPIESNTAYVDLAANGLGCHISSMIVACIWTNQNQKYLRYKPLPPIHHNKIGSEYNKQVEKLFGFDKMDKIESNSIKIPYEEIYWELKVDKKSIDYLRSLFNSDNTFDKTCHEWVIHIRRNDITTTEHKERYIEYSKYNELIELIRNNYQGQIIILSDGNKNEIRENITDKNILIDTNSTSLEAFCKMVYCKNLVVGWSSFSYSAGVYNTNNVYKDLLISHNHNYYHSIPDNWKTLDMQSNSIAIVGMCKNVDLYLNQNVLRMIETISKPFEKAYLYIYTNDNEDNTLDTLLKFKKEKSHLFEDFTIEAEEGITEMNRQDLTILVYGRNKCLNYARSKNAKYMAVIDLDDCLKVCEEQHIKEMTDHLDNENVVAVSKACNKNDFGDKFSYRSERFPLCIYKYTDHTPIWHEVLPKKITKVDSYFGGLCIYKMALCPADAFYDNKDSKGDYCCEHVAFNEKLEGEHYIYCCYN
jgi:FkbM family methyltransferase